MHKKTSKLLENAFKQPKNIPKNAAKHLKKAIKSSNMLLLLKSFKRIKRYVRFALIWLNMHNPLISYANISKYKKIMQKYT